MPSLRTSTCAVLAVVVVLACGGCSRGVVGSRLSPRDGADTASSTPIPAGAPSWAHGDAKLYLSHPHDFARLAASIVASTGLADDTVDRPAFQNDSFVALPTSLGYLSKHDGVWFNVAQDGTGFVYFDNGSSDYPVADGLVYSDSPTESPSYEVAADGESNAVLSTPTPVAPHWWAAAWDPFLFYNGISYDGRDYSAVGIDTATQADPHRFPGPTTTVSGRSIGGVTYEDESDVDVDIVDVGSSKPVPVLTNPHTVRHRARTHGRSVYRVRITTLPGGRRLAFALEAWE